ncbi:MAG TPA: DUF4249 family protein [Draconibacterium sp.]|nr:DUF4249 family protein [Draconibacterium sp.]
MKKILFPILIITLIILISCEKEIIIPQQPYTSKPSIQCLITPGKVPKLYLNETLPYLSPVLSNRKMFIGNANVTISGNGQTDVLQSDSLFEVFYGTESYFYSGSIPIQPNITYTLNIEINGTVYNAEATTNQQVVQIDSVTYVQNFKDIYGEHEGVIFHLKDDPATEDYYRYEMHRMADTATYWGENKFKSPILKNDETTRVTEIGRTIFSDASFSGGEFSFAIEPVFKHKQGDSTFVFLQICDKNIFDFFDELDRQMLGMKNPFTEPVFLKTTQFKDAIGVFGSYALSDSVLFIYPE